MGLRHQSCVEAENCGGYARIGRMSQVFESGCTRPARGRSRIAVHIAMSRAALLWCCGVYSRGKISSHIHCGGQAPGMMEGGIRIRNAANFQNGPSGKTPCSAARIQPGTLTQRRKSNGTPGWRVGGRRLTGGGGPAAVGVPWHGGHERKQQARNRPLPAGARLLGNRPDRPLVPSHWDGLLLVWSLSLSP